jgi:threonine/homoserine/homoserine lactone efflux protein
MNDPNNRQKSAKWEIGTIILLVTAIIMITGGIVSQLFSYAPINTNLICITFGIFFTGIAIRGILSKKNSTT